MIKFLLNLLFSSDKGNRNSSLVKFFIFLPILSPLAALFHNKKAFLKTVVYSTFFISFLIFYILIDIWMDISAKSYFNFWWMYGILLMINLVYIAKNWKNEDNLIVGFCTLFTWAPIVFIIIFLFAAAHLH